MSKSMMAFPSVERKVSPSGTRQAQASQGATVYLRIAATVAIVWFHADISMSVLVGAPGLMVFLLLSFMHASQPTMLLASLRRRSLRMLVPWAFWWAFYASIALYRGNLPRLANPCWPIAWPAAHLWYLPFLFIYSMLVQICQPIFRPLNATGKELIALAIGSGIALSLPHLSLESLPEGSPIWITSTPAVFIGAAMGSCLSKNRPDRLFRVVGIVACVGVLSCYLRSWQMTTEAAAYGFGTALTALSILPVRRSRAITKLALLTPGVYLIHPFAFMVIWKLAPTAPPSWLLVLLGILVSGALAAFLKRQSLTRMLV